MAPSALRSRPQQARDVVGLVVDPLAEIGPSRAEQLVAHPLAVQVHLVQAQRRRRRGTRGERACPERKLSPEKRRGRQGQGSVSSAGVMFGIRRRRLQADPLGFPVAEGAAAPSSNEPAALGARGGRLDPRHAPSTSTPARSPGRCRRTAPGPSPRRRPCRSPTDRRDRRSALAGLLATRIS